jgi:hypothetical protein
MQTFTIGMGRSWFLRLWGRNELVRSSDRVQAWALSVAVAVAVMMVPICAAVGTAVHETRLQMDVAQAHSRHVVAARVHDVATTMSADTPSFTATAQWNAAGRTHVDTVAVPERAHAGDHLDVWVDDRGDLVAAPTPPGEAVDYAVGVAALAWLVALVVLAASFELLRRSLNRHRLAEWDRALGAFVDGTGGRYPSEQ